MKSSGSWLDVLSAERTKWTVIATFRTANGQLPTVIFLTVYCKRQRQYSLAFLFIIFSRAQEDTYILNQRTQEWLPQHPSKKNCILAFAQWYVIWYNMYCKKQRQYSLALLFIIFSRAQEDVYILNQRTQGWLLRHPSKKNCILACSINKCSVCQTWKDKQELEASTSYTSFPQLLFSLSSYGSSVCSPRRNRVYNIHTISLFETYSKWYASCNANLWMKKWPDK